MTPDDLLRDGVSELGLTLSDVEFSRLRSYGELIFKWNKVYNLTAVRDPASVATHHLLDSLAVIEPMRRVCPASKRLLDVGAGAGLPGVVISIVRDGMNVTCVDAVAKKAAFVQQVASELGLKSLRGLHARVESMAGHFDVISSRAFASLPDFVAGSVHLLAEGGVWMAMKGKRPDDEIARLPPDIDVFHVEQLEVPSLDAERCLVWMRKRLA